MNVNTDRLLKSIPIVKDKDGRPCVPVGIAADDGTIIDTRLVPLEEWRKLQLSWEAPLASERERIAKMRLARNLENTGHPFHHLTGNGTIVDRDPSLDRLLSTLPLGKAKQLRRTWMKKARADAAPTMPCDLWWYGFNPHAPALGEEN